MPCSGALAAQRAIAGAQDDEAERPSLNRQPTNAFSCELNERSGRIKSQETVSSLIGSATLTEAEKEERRQAFQRQVAQVRATMAAMDAWTINPNAWYMGYWDCLVILMLLATAVVTPFEIGFYEPKLYSGPVNFALNRAIDSVFAIDLLMQFFIPVRLSPRRGGMLVFDNRRIAAEYLKGWFALDLFTVMPWEWVFAGLALASGSTIDVSMLRMLRVLRILKLARILRASRIFNRWQDHLGLSFTSMSLIQFAFLTTLLAHWMACLWGFMGDPSAPPYVDFSSGSTWIQRQQVPASATEYDLYFICLFVAFNNIFGSEPVSDIGYCANYREFATQCLMLIVGSSVWAYVIGSACGILATADPAAILFRTQMDEVNYFSKDQLLPEELTVNLRSYFRNTTHLIRTHRYDRLLSKMSARLRGDAAYRMVEHKFRRIGFLVNPEIEAEFVCALASKYRTRVYSMLERISCRDLFIVDRGVVAKKGKLGLSGACLGQDVILSNDNLRDLGDAIALTFVQTCALTQADIFELLPEYPMAFVLVRKVSSSVHPPSATCQPALLLANRLALCALALCPLSEDWHLMCSRRRCASRS